jgi:hypothetical protein
VINHYNALKSTEIPERQFEFWATNSQQRVLIHIRGLLEKSLSFSPIPGKDIPEGAVTDLYYVATPGEDTFIAVVSSNAIISIPISGLCAIEGPPELGLVCLALRPAMPLLGTAQEWISRLLKNYRKYR